MNNVINGVTGLVGTVAIMAIDTSVVTTWVTCVCSAAIALVTCGLQIYRMIRDRDKEQSTEENKDDKGDDNNG